MGRVHVDVTDLFEHFLAWGGITGIQRVAVEFARRSTEVDPDARIVAFAHGPGVPVVVPRDMLFGGRDVRAALSAGDPIALLREGPDGERRFWVGRAPKRIRPTLVALRGRALPVLRPLLGRRLPPGVERADLAAGDLLIVPGAVWDNPAHIAYLETVARHGVRIVFVIYDLIMLNRPELTDRYSTERYRRFFTVASAIADSFFCISEWTRTEVVAELARIGRAGLRVEAMPLAHEFLGMTSDADAPPRHPALKALEGRRYVLNVGTVEVRKNHIRLAEAWRGLIAEYGDAVPPLVVAGKLGWTIDAFRTLMDETGWLGGRIIHIGDADDRDIAWLYRNCVFSVFPSTLEGWGLPVGESAWFGRPCVTSNVSSMPEVLGEASLLCDPLSVPSIMEAVRPLILDPAALAAATERVRAMPKRTWTDVAAGLLHAVRA